MQYMDIFVISRIAHYANGRNKLLFSLFVVVVFKNSTFCYGINDLLRKKHRDEVILNTFNHLKNRIFLLC